MDNTNNSESKVRTLQVPRCQSLEGMDIKQIADFLPLVGTPFEIDNVNWPEQFPHKPEVTGRISYSDTRIYVLYEVVGEGVRAVCDHDHGPVWCDSCVEMFVNEPGQPEYMNFEANCIGRMVASHRKSRKEDVVPFPEEDMATIMRFTTLGNAPFEEKPGMHSWKVCISIPWRMITSDGSAPKQLRANFYKCGDETAHPHFLSWNPIPLPKPDFHCPQYFGMIEFVD